VPRVLFAWWYLSIAIGFLLLALRTAMVGGRWWGIAIRLVIAAGFALLAWAEFRRSSR
jgi:hypothetical protein